MALYLGNRLIASIQRILRWGDIQGDIAEQTDLKNALDSKANSADIGDGTITIVQNGATKGTFTVNQAGNTTITVDGGDGSATWGSITGTLSSQTDLNNALDGKVPTSRTVNNKALSSNITLDSTDVGALPNSTKYAADLDYSSDTLQLKDQDGNNIGTGVTIVSFPAVDGDTISYNASDELQTIAVIDNRDSTIRPIWTGTREQYNALQTIEDNVIYNVTDDPNVEGYVNITRTLGQLVTSTIPLVDSNLHLLDGSLIYGNGVYKDFVDYMVSLYGDGTNVPNYFCSESDWQTSVTTYGVCGKFVYDSVNNTIRLPKITGIIEGTTDVTALGDLVEAGLPNITGTFGGIISATGCFSGQVNGGAQFTTDSDKLIISMDASRSSSVYGNSNTVQPQAIKVLYYIVVATIANTEVEVDIDEIATDLNGKADVDLVNVNNNGYIKMAGAAMPSGTYEDLTAGASGSFYIAPADGWFSVDWLHPSNTTYYNFYVRITPNDESTILYSIGGDRNLNDQTECVFIPVKKGYRAKVVYEGGTITMLRFIYAQGSESEAN